MTLIQKVIAVLAGVDLFLWWRSARAARSTPSRGTRLAVHGFFAAQLASLGGMVWGSPHRLPSPVAFLTFIWHVLVAPVALAGSLLGLVGTALAGLLRFLKSPSVPADPPPVAGGVSRREFLGTVAALAPPVLTFSLSAYAAAHVDDFRIRRLTIPLPTLPPALDGMTIVHLSDLHIGLFTKGQVLARIAEAVNRLEGDLLLFTGDLINNELEWLPAAMEMLRTLRPEPVLCEGNHDLISSRLSFEARLKEAGFCLLLNEAVTRMVRGVPVQLLGLRWGGPKNWQDHHNEHDLAASMEQLLAQRDPAAFPILLAHHPHAWDYSADIPLTLSGHTHGGQLMLDERRGFGPLMFRYWSGLYTRPADAQNPTKALVVNNGAGNWFPLRTEAPAEIIHITLRRG